MNQSDAGWKISKVINLGDVITIVIMVASMFVAYNELDKRVEANTQSIKFAKEQRNEDVQRVEKRLEGIDKKLDRLLDKP